jgi:murein DD-endopeptidase MepM/ murein hydrolase activator NlpD
MKVVFFALRRFTFPLRAIVAILIAGSLAACSADSTRLTADTQKQAVSPLREPRVLASEPAGHWVWDGGTGLVVRPGETVSTIARRHHIPASAIIQVNNLTSSNALRAGQRLVLPAYRLSTPPARPELVGSFSQDEGRSYRLGGMQVLQPAVADDGNRGRVASVAFGDLMSNNPARRSSSAPEDKPKVPAATRRKTIATVLKKSPAESKAMLTVGARGMASLKPDDTSPVFSWPAHGPVVALFGVVVEDHKNDGIDIAVPEDTPIQAASDGVVEYAGSALKTYGNLVLLRHAGDYVSVYAHAKTLRVKQGDKVKRGDIIGEAGQTGDAKESQFHFEVRKGLLSVDPLPLLGGD